MPEVATDLEFKPLETLEGTQRNTMMPKTQTCSSFYGLRNNKK